MATRRSKIPHVIQAYRVGPAPEDIREDVLRFTTEDNALRIAEHTAETHLAGWLFYLNDQPIDGLELATTVTVADLSPHRAIAAKVKASAAGAFTWQVEGAAELIALGLDPAGLTVYLSDYRTEHGRVMRKRSATCERAALICAEMDAGTHPRVAIDHHRLPSLRQGPALVAPPDDPDAAALRYYRESLVRGEVAMS
jgi:hypothetical protein